jgi:hypothetical protein
MAQRVEAPAVTIAAGVAASAPATTDLTWQPGRVVRIEVRVPPGPSGLVGFAIGHSEQVVIPRTPDQWIITDDESLDWGVAEYPTGAKWFVRAYNTDIYPHTLYFRFHLDEISGSERILIPALDIFQPDMPTVVSEA